MRFAILGAGFAGLSVTWYLLHYTQGMATIDLYDPEPIGGGNSGLSAGLFHAYVGKQARRNWQAEQGIKETHRLITEASRAIDRPIILSKGLLRPALTSQQIVNFKACADKYHDTEWWDKKECEKKIKGLLIPEEGGGLFIKEGLTLDVPAYLQGLWQTCALLGTQYYKQAMIHRDDLEPYDKILIALGPTAKNFSLLKDLPFKPVKGQMIQLKWPKSLPPLPFSLNSQKYLIMSKDNQTCIAGATYEHEFNSPKPEPEKAIAEIMPKITAYFPALADAEIVGYRVGFRASSDNQLPIVGKITDKVYFYTGLGSRGLLYHAWVGKQVARAMLTQDPKHFPRELYHTLPSKETPPEKS